MIQIILSAISLVFNILDMAMRGYINMKRFIDLISWGKIGLINRLW
jgi:hypothetical protein